MEANKKKQNRVYVKEHSVSFPVSMKPKQRKAWLKAAKAAGMGASAYAIKMMEL